MFLRTPLLSAAVLLLAVLCGSPRPGHGEEVGAVDSVTVDPPTESIINGALRYLAAQQQTNGSWTAAGRRGDHPVAITGYVLLAFMAAGNLPEEGDYARQVNAGMQFLLDSIQPDGMYRGVNAGQYMQNHGIATIALSELYGQTRSPAIRTKLERAVKLIISTQSDRGDAEGGWRYPPFPGDADISVTVMQVVALRAAKDGGLDVPQQTIDDAIAYVRRCQAGSAGGFGYQASRGDPGFARTAAAVYSLQVCGQYHDPLVQPGSEYLFEKNRAGGQWWTYGGNYATPAQYMIGGATWKRWYGLMKDALLGSVRREGDQCHWEGEVGPVYCTAAHATILAMPWHYLHSTSVKPPMRRLSHAWLALFALLAAHTAFAGSIETFTGDIYTGKVELDFGGVLLRPDKGPVSKINLSTVYRVQFDGSASLEEFRPGVVLRNGMRLAAPWGPFNAPVIKFPRRNLSLPAEEIAWIVYTPFPAELAANIPGGQTGALLPKGDFFAGAIRGADASEAKVFNPIFGPRTFPARDIHALILRDTHVPAAQYEVRTSDGSLFAADYLGPDRTGVTIKHTFYDNLLLSSAEIIEIRAGANRCRPLATLGQVRAEPAEGLQMLADRGFSLAAKSVASCVVPAGFTEFVAKVAADESAPTGQRVVFSVSADGRALARSAALAAGDPAQNLRVALSGTHNLILRVDASANAGPDIRGHWIQAFLLRR